MGPTTTTKAAVHMLRGVHSSLRVSQFETVGGVGNAFPSAVNWSVQFGQCVKLE